MQKPKEAGGKPVSDQWIPPFVIVDDDNNPVGPIEASSSSTSVHLMILQRTMKMADVSQN